MSEEIVETQKKNPFVYSSNKAYKDQTPAQKHDAQFAYQIYGKENKKSTLFASEGGKNLIISEQGSDDDEVQEFLASEPFQMDANQSIYQPNQDSKRNHHTEYADVEIQNAKPVKQAGRGGHRRITSQPENFGKQLIESKVSPKPQALKQRVSAVYPKKDGLTTVGSPMTSVNTKAKAVKSSNSLQATTYVKKCNSLNQ